MRVWELLPALLVIVMTENLLFCLHENDQINADFEEEDKRDKEEGDKANAINNLQEIC